MNTPATKIAADLAAGLASLGMDPEQASEYAIEKTLAQDFPTGGGSDLATLGPGQRVLDTKTDRFGRILKREPGFDYMGYWPVAYEDGGALCVHTSHLRAA